MLEILLQDQAQADSGKRSDFYSNHDAQCFVPDKDLFDSDKMMTEADLFKSHLSYAKHISPEGKTICSYDRN